MLAEGEFESTTPSPAALPRRAVPLTFSPIINDEANILCHIARGDFTLAELAIKYETTVSAFCLWLQRDDIQQKLNDLTTAGATLTRIAAVNQLPRAVTAMTAQIDGYEFDRAHNLIKPGLAADKVAALRDANIRKACTLLLRLARFDPTQPVYRKREPAGRALNKLPQGGAVEQATASETEGAPAFSTGSSSRPPSSLPTSEFQLPTSNSDLATLCSTALSAISESRFADVVSQVRSPLPIQSDERPRNNRTVPSAMNQRLARSPAATGSRRWPSAQPDDAGDPPQPSISAPARSPPRIVAY